MSKDSKKPVRGRAPKDNGRKFKKKANVLSAEKIEYIDYKDVNLLTRFVSDRSKIRNRRVTGNSVQQQREIANAIKNSREMALMPYTKRVAQTRTGRGGRDGERGERGPRADRDQVQQSQVEGTEVEELELDEVEATESTETEEA